MIDHETARRSLASSLDFPLEPRNARRSTSIFVPARLPRLRSRAQRAMLAVLRDIDLGPVPVAVRANVAIAAERRVLAAASVAGSRIAAVGALLLVALGAGALGFGGSAVERGRGDGAGDGAGPARAAAGRLADEGRAPVRCATSRSSPAARPSAARVRWRVNSDPGDATYRTLEATWRENGVEMRLNLYFGGDASAWWVSEIRIYNGYGQGRVAVRAGQLLQEPARADLVRRPGHRDDRSRGRRRAARARPFRWPDARQPPVRRRQRADRWREGAAGGRAAVRSRRSPALLGHPPDDAQSRQRRPCCGSGIG